MDRVCHFEIPYSDKARSQKFYAETFGWQISDAPTENPYSFCITTPVNEQFMPEQAGGINGGMYPRGDEGGSPNPVVVIEVESTEQRMQDVVANGGSAIMGPATIPNMGIYAQVKDTEDNIIGLWQPLQPGG